MLSMPRWEGSQKFGVMSMCAHAAEANEDFAADFTRLHSRRYGKLGGYHVLPELAAPVGPDSVAVQLRTDDTELPHSYHSGYPFEAWSGPSLS